jgi:hypothetical protein
LVATHFPTLFDTFSHNFGDIMRVFVVTSHVEVEPNNWSSEVVKVFFKKEDAEAFADELRSYAESNETVEIDTVEME